MAVGFDAASESSTGTTGQSGAASFSWSHGGGASARGALVFVFGVVTNALPPVSSVTYGGQTMTAVPYTAIDTDTEPGSVRAYWLDNVPTGTQTVQVNRSDSTPWAHVLYAVCFTVTALGEIEVHLPGVKTFGGSSSNTAASTSGSGTGTLGVTAVDDGSPGTNSLRFMGRYQGTSNVTAAGTGSTAGPSIDFGLYVIDTFRETTASQGASNVGGASITDDLAAIALAIREVPPVAKSGSDSGTGTDSATLAAQVSSSDSGTATDAVGSIGISSSESGTATEAAVVTVAKVGSESGTGTDLASLAAALTSSESGAGTDAASPPVVSLVSSDAGTGTDLVSSIRLPTFTDAATGQETASLAASLSGSGEGGTGTEVASLAVQASASEAGVGTESATVTVQVSASESGSGTDASTAPAVQVSASESGTGTDGATVDQGSGAKSGSEDGTATDLAFLSVQVSGGEESGTATETASVTVQIDVTEEGVGSDGFGDLLALLQGDDSALATELASVQSGPLVPRPGMAVTEGPTAGTTIGDRGRYGGRATDQERTTVGVTDG